MIDWNPTKLYQIISIVTQLQHPPLPSPPLPEVIKLKLKSHKFITCIYSPGVLKNLLRKL